ncbi:basic salivary proline-rich protein 2-like [Vulpes lagopus]|uniref:basic salivary proline-rich protein 2-like n=1 Tax=Vulpes lagopus TaxID=494514 RepID=UPI001BCA27C1|nr:basic salivary proline-rich protein 2-like [Vulpes lagopus]
MGREPRKRTQPLALRREAEFAAGRGQGRRAAAVGEGDATGALRPKRLISAPLGRENEPAVLRGGPDVSRLTGRARNRTRVLQARRPGVPRVQPGMRAAWRREGRRCPGRPRPPSPPPAAPQPPLPPQNVPPTRQAALPRLPRAESGGRVGTPRGAPPRPRDPAAIPPAAQASRRWSRADSPGKEEEGKSHPETRLAVPGSKVTFPREAPVQGGAQVPRTPGQGPRQGPGLLEAVRAPAPCGPRGAEVRREPGVRPPLATRCRCCSQVEGPGPARLRIPLPGPGRPSVCDPAWGDQALDSEIQNSLPRQPPPTFQNLSKPPPGPSLLRVGDIATVN